MNQMWKDRHERLMEMLNDPLIRDICNGLYEHALSEDDGAATEDLYGKIGVVVSEALRVSYRLSKEIGLDKISFLSSLNALMDNEDLDYNESVFN